MCDRDEWAWLQSHVYTTVNGSVQNLLNGDDDKLIENNGLVEFVTSVRAAITHLLTKLNIPLYRVSTFTNTPKIIMLIRICELLWGKIFKTTSSLFFCARPISMEYTPGNSCSLVISCLCCFCCLPVRTSVPVTGPWWGPRNLVSPCRCRFLNSVSREEE